MFIRKFEKLYNKIIAETLLCEDAAEQQAEPAEQQNQDSDDQQNNEQSTNTPIEATDEQKKIANGILLAAKKNNRNIIEIIKGFPKDNEQLTIIKNTTRSCVKNPVETNSTAYNELFNKLIAAISTIEANDPNNTNLKKLKDELAKTEENNEDDSQAKAFSMLFGKKNKIYSLFKNMKNMQNNNNNQNIISNPITKMQAQTKTTDQTETQN